MVPASRRLDRVDPHEPLPGLAQHEVGRRDARLLRRGGAVRADQPGVQLDADRQQLGHPRRGQHRQPVGGVHARRARQPDLGPAGPAADAEPAGLRRLLPGRLGGDGPPHREPRPALGIRAGSDRQGQPLVAAARPDPADSRDGRDAAADAGAGPAAHGQQGLRLFVQRRVDLHHRRGPQRVGHLAVELHAAGRGELPPRRDHGGAGGLRPLPDADQQRPRHARRLRQPVHRLRADHDDARPDQRPAEPDPGRSVPGGRQPGDRALRAGLRPLHRPGQRGQPRPVPAAAAAERSLHRLVPEGDLGRHHRRRQLLLQLGLARALRHQPEHVRPDLPLRAEGGAEHVGAEPVPQLPDARRRSRARPATPPT